MQLLLRRRAPSMTADKHHRPDSLPLMLKSKLNHQQPKSAAVINAQSLYNIRHQSDASTSAIGDEQLIDTGDDMWGKH